MSPRPRAPRFALALLIIAAALSTGCGHHDDHLPRANPRPSKLPAAPSPQAYTVTLPDGRTLTCPTGAAPQAKRTAATCAPPLTDGTTLSPGQYRVTLHVILENETTAAIAVQALTVTVGGQQWNTPITTPDAIPAESTAELVLDGTQQSPGTHAATVVALLDWQWQATDLRH